MTRLRRLELKLIDQAAKLLGVDRDYARAEAERIQGLSKEQLLAELRGAFQQTVAVINGEEDKRIRYTLEGDPEAPFYNEECAECGRSADFHSIALGHRFTRCDPPRAAYSVAWWERKE